MEGIDNETESFIKKIKGINNIFIDEDKYNITIHYDPDIIGNSYVY